MWIIILAVLLPICVGLLSLRSHLATKQSDDQSPYIGL